MKPTFLGLGGQKCASSWIHKVLEDHPQVFVSDPKELDFFTHRYDRGYTWYERCFAGACGAPMIGEISPSYFCDAQAPARVRAYAPEMRFVLALRDPVERAFSNHLHEIRKGHYRAEDLTIEAGLARNPMYLEQSRYGTLLVRWLDAFPLERFLILVQEDIQVRPEVEARRLYAFLGVDPDHRSASVFTRSHESVGARNITLFRSLRAMGDIGRRRGLERLVAATKAFPPVRMLMEANKRHLRAEIPPMRAETVAALRRELAPEVARLAALTGRSDWPWATVQAAARPAVAPPASAANCSVSGPTLGNGDRRSFAGW
jgi:hypothetical protein